MDIFGYEGIRHVRVYASLTPSMMTAELLYRHTAEHSSYTHTYTGTVCMHIHTYNLHTYIHTQTHIHIHTYIHTHSHTHIHMLAFSLSIIYKENSPSSPSRVCFQKIVPDFVSSPIARITRGAPGDAYSVPAFKWPLHPSCPTYTLVP